MEQTTPEAVVDEAILEEEKPVEEEFEKKDKKEEEQQEEKEESSEAEKEAQKESEDKKDDNEEDEKEKQKKANHALQEEYNTLNQRYSALEQEKLALEDELNELREFKKGVERVQKQEMIDSFFMLSDEDKADVINNIDTYSLDDIEAKLSVICVRNKVNLSVSEDKKETDPMVYNLQSENTVEPEIPDWIKALNAVVAENNF